MKFIGNNFSIRVRFNITKAKSVTTALTLAGVLLGMVGQNSHAAPVFAIDLDTATPGIQASATLMPVQSRTAQVVMYNDTAGGGGIDVAGVAAHLTNSNPAVALFSSDLEAAAFAGSLMMAGRIRSRNDCVG